jgi:hypothetical protein
LSYIQSRQFYCNFYEQLASQQADFRHLKQKLIDGYNLQIVGYDGRSMAGVTAEQAYLDPSAPFGHELVLYCMLTIENKDDLPWRKHKTFDL